MQILIVAGVDIIVEPRTKFSLGLMKVRSEEDVVAEPPLPERPAKPPMPPKTVLDGTTSESGPGVRVISPPPSPPAGGTTELGINYGDGPLFNIFKVSPNYPATAIARGLEGTVLVQYDVTTTGQVTNVVVLESSNRVFDNAAVAAAYRFKYKPKTIDGILYETKGLRNLFRFEMEQ